jgi:hypothetical protein
MSTDGGSPGAGPSRRSLNRGSAGTLSRSGSSHMITVTNTGDEHPSVLVEELPPSAAPSELGDGLEAPLLGASGGAARRGDEDAAAAGRSFRRQLAWALSLSWVVNFALLAAKVGLLGLGAGGLGSGMRREWSAAGRARWGPAARPAQLPPPAAAPCSRPARPPSSCSRMIQHAGVRLPPLALQGRAGVAGGLCGRHRVAGDSRLACSTCWWAGAAAGAAVVPGRRLSGSAACGAAAGG